MRNALDLFSGMGGASLGLERAGFHVTGVEYDEKACELHDHVCAGPIVQGDIAEMNPQHWSHFNFELLWASPPCQPFSQAGLRKGMEDPRAHLIFEVPRWVHTLRPRYVICEQVRAALPWWESFAADFEQHGYHTWTGLVSAEQFGVPQTRVRAIMLASLDGPVSEPEPTHHKFYSRPPHIRPKLGEEHLLPYVTMADVIDIDEDDLVGFPRRDDQGGDGYRDRDMRPGSDPAFTVTSKGRSWQVNTGRDWKPGSDRSTAQTRGADHPAPTVTVCSTSAWQLQGRQSKATVRHDGQPAPTITAGHDVSQWTLKQRLISVQDGLVLQGFPRDCLDGIDITKTAAFRAVGNAVPPPLATAMAQHLKGGDE
jgi:DNA (cytosine-5)-methyltransferase 1